MSDVHAALAKRFQSPEWILLTEVRDDAGWRGSRSADAVAIRAIGMSRLFWLLYPRKPTIGAWVELGCAASRGKTIVISGDWRASIFTSLADHVFDTHERAFDWIVGRESGGER